MLFLTGLKQVEKERQELLTIGAVMVKMRTQSLRALYKPKMIICFHFASKSVQLRIPMAILSNYKSHKMVVTENRNISEPHQY